MTDDNRAPVCCKACDANDGPCEKKPAHGHYYDTGKPPGVLYIGVTHHRLPIYAFPDQSAAMYWLAKEETDPNDYLLRKRLWRVRVDDVVELGYFAPEPYLFEVARGDDES